MEIIDGATIFWLIALGMLMGGAAKVVMWNTNVGLIPNVLAGAAGAVVMGGLIAMLNMDGFLLFAFIGSIAILFIINVFNMEGQNAH